MEKPNQQKMGLLSMTLLSINAIIGSGIFLLPNQAMKLIGPASIGVLFFDALLIGSIALCFAESASYFKVDGGPYIYAKSAFGNFVGYEVGFITWAIQIIAEATMVVAFATALGTLFPVLATPIAKNIIVTIVVLSLMVMNISGVRVSKFVNNIITVSKLVPLVLFVALGIFFMKGGNFTPVFPKGHYQSGSFGLAAITMFYAFTGVERISVAAGDMENPERNLPRAIMTSLLVVTAFYVLIQIVSVGVLGPELANTATPIQTAFGKFAGSFGTALVAAGTLISITGICVASSYVTPRSGVALAENKMMPQGLAKRNRRHAPYVSIIVSGALSLVIAWSGQFAYLAQISAVSRFAQYIPTCLAVLVFHRTEKQLPGHFRVPLGPVIPVLALVISGWLLTQVEVNQLLIGLGALVIAIPFYFLMEHLNRQAAGK